MEGIGKGKGELVCSSERVKCLDVNNDPTSPWILATLHTGTAIIYNYITKTKLKEFEVTNKPVRACKWIPRKGWILCGDDDGQLSVYDYNANLLKQFPAHSDYIRSIAVHPELPLILSCSDDKTIKLWDWEKEWQTIRTYSGHTHYVMRVVFNPHDSNCFASASLDHSVKVWRLEKSSPLFTLQGHEQGVNTVEYHPLEKSYLISGGDEKTIKIWDYHTNTCLQSISGHGGNITSVVFHPGHPTIISAAEDQEVKFWNASTYQLEKEIDHRLGRPWCISSIHGTNTILIGFDKGTLIL